MYWQRIVWEIINKNKESNFNFFTPINGKAKSSEISSEEKSEQSKKSPKIKKPDDRYLLTGKNNKMQLSHREEQCVSCMILGKTLNDMSKCLSLSVRTVEFYVKNIRGKMKCRTREELIKMVLSSTFWEDHIVRCKGEIKFDWTR
ncbi:MAG: helix-turn-helix transcriptional regulator [Gammaproteobacteria bacterium]